MLVIIGHRHYSGLRNVFVPALGVWIYAYVWLTSSVLAVSRICFSLSCFNLMMDVAGLKHFLEGEEGLWTGMPVLRNLENTTEDRARDLQVVIGTNVAQWQSACGRLGRRQVGILEGGGLMQTLSTEVVPKGLIIWAIWWSPAGVEVSFSSSTRLFFCGPKVVGVWG